MKECKKYLIYYNEAHQLIGLREHHFDWEEGDTITTNGVSTVIFGIFEGTDKNRTLAGWLFKTLRSFLPKKKREKIVNADYEYIGWWDDEDDEIENLKKARQQFIDAHKQIWKDFDAELDFIDKVFDIMD